MTKLEFHDICFEENKGSIRITFLRIFYTDINKEELQSIGKFTIGKHHIDFGNIPEERARKRFDRILSAGFSNLRNRINSKHTIYIHKNSGIPLIGHNAFGIVDRNTNLIEVKPITSCNMDCVFCSVDPTRRKTDFVVERDYLAQELKKLIESKQCDDIEVVINTHGEPLLYSGTVNLVKDIKNIPQVRRIFIFTNATLLNEKYIDELMDAGLTRFNISLNAIDPKKAKELAGSKAYNLKRILELCRYIAKRHRLLIAPVWVPGLSNDQMPKIIDFVKELNKGSKHEVFLRIQNFLPYKFGKAPSKQKPMQKFYSDLKELENNHGISLIGPDNVSRITKTRSLPKPFERGDIIKANIACKGPLPGEMIAVAKDRIISIPNCTKSKGTIRLKLTRSKHNIFCGVVV